MAQAAALVVALSASLSKFQKDMDHATTIADNTVKGMEESFTKFNPDASEALKKFSDNAQAPAQAAGLSIGTAVLVGLAAGLAAVASHVGSVINALSKIGDRAEELRLPVNLLQSLSVAADAARLPQEKLNSALDKFSEVSKKTRGDAEDFYKALSNIGAGFATAFEKAPTQEARLRIVSNALASTTDEVKKAQLSLAAFGTENLRAVQVLGQGSTEFDKARERMRALGLEINEATVKRAQEARSQLSLLARVVTDELSSSLAGLIPKLSSIVPLMEKLGAAIKDIIAVFQAESLKGADTLEREAATIGQEIEKLDQQLADLGKDKTPAQEWADKTKETLQKSLVEFGIYTKEQLETTKETITAERDELVKRLEEVQQRIREIRKSGEAVPTTGTGPAFTGRPSLSDKGGSDQDAFQRQVDSINRHIAALNADAAAVGLTAAAHEQLRAELALLQAIERDDGEITQKQIDLYAEKRASMSQEQALIAAGITLNKEHADSFKSISDRMLEAAGNADKLKRAYAGVQSAIQFGGNELITIMDGLRTKTLSAADAMRNLTNAIIHALEQALLLGSGPLAGILGTQTAVPGGTGGILGTLFNSLLKTSSGGLPLGQGGIGHAQSGGPVSGGRAYVVGEHGMELFVPSSSGHIIPNVSPGRSGGGTAIEINNYTAADSETKQTRQQGPNGERIIIDIVKKAQARGQLDDVNRGRFALRPAKVR